jgi:uncharacterized membrane protein
LFLNEEKDKLARKLILIVKLVAIVSIFLILLLLSSTAFAQIQYYGVDVSLDEKGKAQVKLTLTFLKPEEEFDFKIIGKIEKFGASSMGIPVDCSVTSGGISYVKCKLNLTQERRTVDLKFETKDFVRVIEDKYFFDADFSLGKNISSLFVSVKLPEGFGLVSEEKGRISFPGDVTILSDGRHHIISWRFVDLAENQSLRFYVLYERVQGPQASDLIFYITVFVVAAIAFSIFLYFRFLRKPEKIILSVLDEFERKVFDAIKEAGGEVNQKRVVQATNLSKAKVSRVVKSLAERGLIEIERLGRTNKLKIVKKKLKFF